MTEKAIIFDLDGTVLDSMPVWKDIDKQFLNEYGIEYPDWLEDIMKTLTLTQSAEYFINTFKIDMTVEQVIQKIREMVDNKYRYEIGLKPFIKEFIKQQHELGVKMCIATATHSELAKIALERLDIAKYFKFVITCEDVGHEKNEPHIYLEAASKLGFEISDICIFEDALHCIKTAKKAGFKVVGVHDLSAFSQKDEINKYCDLYIHSYEELLN